MGDVERAGQKLPAGHATCVAGVSHHEPAGQLASAEAPSAQYEPDAHGEHSSLEMARVAAENVPAGHATRVVAVGQYEPAPQSAHVAPADVSAGSSMPPVTVQ